MRWVESSISLHKLHLSTIVHPLYINMFIVKIFPHTTSQVRKHILKGVVEPQICLVGKSIQVSTRKEL